MSELLIVVDNLKDWGPYYPTENVITFEDYLARQETHKKARTRVINLCRNYRYLSKGYYCSLLAEARDHHVLPSIRVINDLNQPVPATEKAAAGLMKEWEALRSCTNLTAQRG